jgi:hypothetical protein
MRSQLYLLRNWFGLWLRSAVGERKQWSADGETDGTESERNAAAEPQTEAPANADNQMQLVTRARLATSEAQQAAPWSRRLKVLVGQPLSGVGVNLAACEQLGMDAGGRCGSVSAANERPQQPH